MNLEPSAKARDTWQVPAFSEDMWCGRQHPWCVVIPVINEGERIRSLLARMAALGIPALADIIIADGGSTDGSLDPAALQGHGVRGVLVKKDPGRLSAQLRCAYAFAMDQGYEGVITIDGNDKDDPSAIPAFLEALESGVDFVQGSRFIPGGRAVNTPAARNLAIRLIHAPLLAACSGHPWTDTTQGFRAYSARLLLHPGLDLFREVFTNYELLAYISYRAPRVGLTCRELPTTRVYPSGKVPTKISAWRGQWDLVKTLITACRGGYNPASGV